MQLSLKIKALVVITSIFTLSACMEDTPSVGNKLPALPTAEQDSCGALSFAEYIGQPVTAFEALPKRQDTAQRILRPGQPVTMDYLAQRLNVELDARDTIIRLSCG